METKKTKQELDLIVTKICMKKDLGVHNNLFGGNLMSWIDEAGASYASKYCDCTRMVTVKVDELLFKKPIKEGNLVNIYGYVKELGNSSIKLYMTVRIHNPESGQEFEATSTTITFVRIDENGNSMPISNHIKEKFKERNTLKSKSATLLN